MRIGSRSRSLVVIVAAIAACTIAFAGPVATEPPDIETATSRWGTARVLRASYAPSVSPVPLIALHSWTVHVTDAAGRPVDGAELTVVGGMPEHTHGLPTVPQVTALGGGDYRIDGLKFHMPGRWSVIVRIARSADETDSVRFDLDVR
jgi:hypothetical protein